MNQTPQTATATSNPSEVDRFRGFEAEAARASRSEDDTSARPVEHAGGVLEVSTTSTV
jgi:hypothetical protein